MVGVISKIIVDIVGGIMVIVVPARFEEDVSV